MRERCGIAFALGWDKECSVHCFGHHNHPGVSEKKCSILQYCHHNFLHQQGKSKALARPSTWSGDNGVTKDLGHLLWQLKWHHGGGGSLETFGSAEGTVHQGGWVCLEMLILKFCIRVLFLEQAVFSSDFIMP